MQLRPRHLDHIDNMARSDETIADLRDKLANNYVYFYGRLRPKYRSVPSDALRQNIIVHQILVLVEQRRDEIQAAARHEGIAAYDSAYGY